MSFKFDSLSGRLAPSTSSVAYNPQGLQKTPQVEDTFRFGSSTIKPVVETPVRGASGAGSPEGARGVVPKHPGYQKFRALQTALSKDDGILVWQKRGARDKLPYWATMIGVGLGTCYCLSILWKMSWPKKNDGPCD